MCCCRVVGLVVAGPFVKLEITRVDLGSLMILLGIVLITSVGGGIKAAAVA